MHLIILFAIILALIVVGMSIPPDARYEIWPSLRRLDESDRNDEDNPR